MTIIIPKPIAYVLATTEFIFRLIPRFIQLDIELMKKGHRDWVDRNLSYFIRNEQKKLFAEVFGKWDLLIDEFEQGLQNYVAEGTQEDDKQYWDKQKNEGVE